MRIALPSDGELYDSTIAFMRACGLTVSRPNSRRYTGTVPAIPGVEVLFQRTADVTQKVEEGSAELGVLLLGAARRTADGGRCGEVARQRRARARRVD